MNVRGREQRARGSRTPPPTQVSGLLAASCTAGGGGGAFKCLGSEGGIPRGMGMSVSRQLPENAVGAPGAATDGPAQEHRHSRQRHRRSASRLCFLRTRSPVFPRCSPNRGSVSGGGEGGGGGRTAVRHPGGERRRGPAVETTMGTSETSPLFIYQVI